MHTSTRRTRPYVASLALLLSLGMVTASGPSAGAVTQPEPLTLTEKLADGYRVRPTDLRVRLDYHPDRARVRGEATMRFRMRAGQRRAVFHFNPSRGLSPARERRLISSVQVDGRRVAPAALKVVRTGQGAETGFATPRPLASDVEHRLQVRWSAPAGGRRGGWLFAPYDDTEGPSSEIETPWPTISSPEAMMRHRIALRVHDDSQWRAIGSGVATRQGRRSWLIDTRGPVSSSNVFFAAAPARDVRLLRFDASGVPVTILSNRSPRVNRRAMAITRRTLAELTRDFGTFPMPRMQILLTGWSSGMEYYGATRTGIGSLRHELAHMYFGTSAVNRTWRDTWIDEAITTWWADDRRARPIRRSFRSRVAGGRSVLAPGFDEDAYDLGPRILARVGRALAPGTNGEAALIDFLADVYQRRAGRPFTTHALMSDVLEERTWITRRDLRRWLYAR